MPDQTWTLPKDQWEEIGGDTLTVEEAAKIIRKRLGLYEQVTGDMEGWSDKSAAKKNQTGGYDLSLALANALPKEALNDQVLLNMDMRTLLQPVFTTQFAAEQRGDITVNGQTFTPAMQTKAGSAFMQYKKKVADDFEMKMLDAGATPDQAADAVNAEMQRWREHPDQFTRLHSPEGTILTDPNTGGVQVTGANEDLTDLASMFSQVMNGTGTGEAPPAFMTADDFAMMAEDTDPGSMITKYRNDIAARSEYERTTGLNAEDDPTLITWDKGTRTNIGATGVGSKSVKATPLTPQERNQTITGAETYTLSQARRLPNTMTRSQITALTAKMKKAGLFAQVGAEPLVKGDPQDPAFTEAYRLLLSKTIQRGEPINDILAADSLAYEEELDTKIRAKLTDPARLRASADSLGRQILGRSLTSSDQAKLVSFIHDLEHKQAVSEQDTDATGDVTDVDWEARMGEYIKNANPGEAGAHDVAQQFDVFRSLLAGPGGSRG